MNFSQALILLKGGARISRQGWNGRGMWLELILSMDYTIHHHDIADQRNVLLPWIVMKTADSKFVPWLASQTDILADDWGQVMQSD